MGGPGQTNGVLAPKRGLVGGKGKPVPYHLVTKEAPTGAPNLGWHKGAAKVVLHAVPVQQLLVSGHQLNPLWVQMQLPSAHTHSDSVLHLAQAQIDIRCT